MKIYLLAIAASLFMLSAHAQNIGINDDRSAPNPNAILDVKSSTKGLLIPRLTTTNRLAIPNIKGLLVYDSTASLFFFNTGADWKPLQPAAGYWTLSGDPGAGAFIGTTDSSALLFKAADLGSGSIDSKTGNTFWGYNTDSVYIVDSLHNNNNTGIGSNSLNENVTGSFNTMMGRWSMPESKTAGHNTGMGTITFGHNETGTLNTGFGYSTLRNNRTGNGNTAVGPYALFNNQTGNFNTAAGSSAGSGNKDGSFNTAIGYDAYAFASAGSYNTTLGYFAFTSGASTGNDNTVAGLSTMQNNTTGSYNTAMSYASMSANTTGNNNTAIGPQSLQHNDIGNFNTAIGLFALDVNTSGSYNTAIGRALHTNVTGSFNTAVGYNADVSTDGLTNATAIGFGAVVNASNKVRLGNTNITAIEGAVPFTTPSDGRYKYDVQEDVRGLDFILQLRPVTYLFDAKRLQQKLTKYAKYTPTTTTTTIRRSGFIAQEVEQAAIKTGYDFSGINKPTSSRSYYTLSYESFVVPLVKGMQQQQQLLENLDKEIETLERKSRKIAALQQEINELGQTLNKMTNEKN
ncbi:MAG: tail fiber domain-containing protein [Bacteroidetes bacterium]|nr:tail fiber domain-containing protein [Bacteroidota bacterium]